MTNNKNKFNGFLKIGGYMLGAALVARFGLDAAINANHFISLSKEIVFESDKLDQLVMKGVFVISDIYVAFYFSRKMLNNLDEIYGVDCKKHTAAERLCKDAGSVSSTLKIKA